MTTCLGFAWTGSAWRSAATASWAGINARTSAGQKEADAAVELFSVKRFHILIKPNTIHYLHISLNLSEKLRANVQFSRI